ncbi:Fc receptor-like protein 5 isoform X2 [Esox lucius]|uniref:Ig-like domain-containing protein n=2 Tax=Esox lucius TaxID=8010 RepID=A0AAY5KIY2_ESOLU|nr:Fc receptor-like protein 5 isoform X2 [Esox lucius]XP_028978118.1 Fc receptor-like protein 5 isoform X2 [Esox lucius]XP_034149955.1 Fc receptor-like protein 5 isoform X2 [Esox lucius]
MTPATVTEGQNVTLTCITSCPLTDNPTYIWYKNRQRLNNRNTSSNIQILKLVSSEDRGRYSCAVEGHEDFSSPEHTVNVQYGPKNTAVSVSPSGEIMEGSSLTLFCTSDANPPVDKYTWYKKTVTSPKASGQRYSITNIRSEDSGEYYCEAENGRGSMNSTALMITVAGEKILFITASVGITVVVLLIILCLSGFIWFRKRSSKSTSETKDKADDGLKDSMYVNLSSRIMRSSTAQTKTTDTVDDGHGDSNPIYNNL